MPRISPSVHPGYGCFTGTLKARGKTHKIEDGRVRGEEIRFTAGDRTFTGTVKGKRMKVAETKVAAVR